MPGVDWGILWKGSDNLVSFGALTDNTAFTQATVDTATMTAALLDSSEDVVIPAVTLPVVGSGNGNYEGLFTVAAVDALITDALYTVLYTALDGVNRTGEWRKAVYVREPVVLVTDPHGRP